MKCEQMGKVYIGRVSILVLAQVHAVRSNVRTMANYTKETEANNAIAHLMDSLLHFLLIPRSRVEAMLVACGCRLRCVINL